jgi:Zn finger protein HypA/HybF involved in hydrogenase expression
MMSFTVGDVLQAKNARIIIATLPHSTKCKLCGIKLGLHTHITAACPDRKGFFQA